MVDTDYKWDVFICHASEDKVIATPLYNQLKKAGLKNIWYDKESMYAGDNIVEKVKEGLNKSLIVVLIASKDSLDKNFPRMEIGGVLFNPKEAGDRLTPLRYKISREDVLKKINIYGDLLNLQVGDDENAYKKELKAAVNDIIKKVKITKTEREEQIKREKRKRIFRIIKNSGIALAIILPILYSAFLVNRFIINRNSNDYIYSITPFDTTKSSYNVLLLPFQPLEMCRFKKTNIELTIISHLFLLSEKDGLNLSIKYDTLDCIHSSAEAESIGKKLKANLVIWGDLYEHCTSDNEASLRFVNISPASTVPGLDLKGESGIEKLSSLSEVKEGKLQRNTDYIIYWVAAIRSFYKQNFTKALQYFTKIQNSFIVTSDLYLYIGCCNFSLESYKEAKEYFEKALKIDPNSADAHYNYAGSLEQLNDLNGAKEYYETALKINPNYAEAHNNYAILLEKLNDLNGAKEHYEKALKIDPNNAVIHLNYAILLHEKINDFKTAKEHYEKVLEINPNSASAHNGYAILLSELNDLDGVKKHLERALIIDPKFAWGHYNYARFLEKINDLKGAKEHYEKALKIDPNFAIAHNNYAHFLEILNDPSGAKEHYEKALKIDPNYAGAQNNYASFLEKLNDLKGARKHFEIALKINPNFAIAQNNYASFLGKLNDLNGAKEHYEKALKIDPNNAVIHLNYAILLEEKFHDLERAKNHYLEAVRFKPKLKTKENDAYFGIK